MVSSPTRVTDSTATLLDVIITTNANQIREVKIIESSVSDHDLVYAILRLKKQRAKPVYITTGALNAINLRHFTRISNKPLGQS